MKLLHLATPDGTNARVALLRGQRREQKAIKVTPEHQLVRSRTIHRGRAPADPGSLDAQALIDGDPELDLANVGRIVHETHTAFHREDSTSLEGGFGVIVTTYAPDGTVKSRSPYIPQTSNINNASPIQIGQRLKLPDLFARIVSHGQLYLGHADGLQYAFLYRIARDLHEAGEAAFLGAGPRGNLPLILTNGAVPTRAFLLGDVDGDRYRLRVLLSRQELKLPDVRTTT